MSEITDFYPGHKDVIHDIAYDFTGHRMSTCSSDHHVKIWDMGEDGEWKCTASFRAHKASVHRVTWAHPEFGQVIATCSNDHQVRIWTETLQLSRTSRLAPEKWAMCKEILQLSRVTDVQFGPRHHGLILAFCLKDGTVQVSYAPEMFNCEQWVDDAVIKLKVSCSCIAWSQSRFKQAMFAVGSADSTKDSAAKVTIIANVYGQWQKVQTIVSLTQPVYSLAFAPNMGRSYDMLAVAGQDICLLKLKSKKERINRRVPRKYQTPFAISYVAHLESHRSKVHRVVWNILGNILLSSGGDGCVRVWKANEYDVWECVSVKEVKRSIAAATDFGPSTSGATAADFGPSTSGFLAHDSK